MAWIAERARAAGAQRLTAELVATAKNKPFASFYKDRGLVEGRWIGDVQEWFWDLAAADTALPDWINLCVIDSRTRS